MMSLSVSLTGGSPWGFKMKGGKDFHLPLTIGKLTPGGKASRFGVKEGYVIEKVNGEDVTNISHHAAQNRIKASGYHLTLFLRKPKPRENPDDISPSSSFSWSPRPGSIEHHSSRLPYANHELCQNENNIAQSPSLYVKTQPLKDTVARNEKPRLKISREIKDMINNDEGFQSARMETGKVKIWQPENKILPPSSSPQNRWNESNFSYKSKAADNIGRFFLSPSAPRYGEPSFAKLLPSGNPSCVIDLRRPLQPLHHQALRDANCPLGEPVVLEIRLGPDLPVPSVNWYHGNRVVHDSPEKDRRILSNGPVHTLVLGELSSELEGRYTCTIVNSYGSRSTSCVVKASVEQAKEEKSTATHYRVSSGPQTGANSSIGLYSKEAVQDLYWSQKGLKSSRSSLEEESEVLKALRQDPPKKSHYRTPSMKFLEESLLPESEDL